MPSVQELYEIAKKAADIASAIHLDYASSFETQSKDSRYNLVTTADLASEKAVVSLIQEAFPDHSFLAEENRYPAGDSDYLWIIDPLDGTNNYAKGLPNYAVSIALVKAGEPLLGIVQAPARRETYSAIRGEGAQLNGKPIRVSPVDDLKDAMVGTGFYYDRDAGMKETLELIEAFFRREIVGIRRHGSAALDFCQVACGRFDLFFELKNQPWDYAAGALIVQEAGGQVSDRSGRPLSYQASSVAATNGLLHPEVLGLLKPQGA